MAREESAVVLSCASMPVRICGVEGGPQQATHRVCAHAQLFMMYALRHDVLSVIGVFSDYPGAPCRRNMTGPVRSSVMSSHRANGGGGDVIVPAPPRGTGRDDDGVRQLRAEDGRGDACEPLLLLVRGGPRRGRLAAGSFRRCWRCDELTRSPFCVPAGTGIRMVGTRRRQPPPLLLGLRRTKRAGGRRWWWANRGARWRRGWSRLCPSETSPQRRAPFSGRLSRQRWRRRPPLRS